MVAGQMDSSSMIFFRTGQFVLFSLYLNYIFRKQEGQVHEI